MEQHEIEYRGVFVVVVGEYEPSEPTIRYYEDMSGYPGASATFTIQNVMVEDVDISELLSYEQLNEIENLIIEKFYGI